MGIEPSFQEFQDSLFSRASLTLERSVQSKEVNQKLDEDISLFLCRLSPYFLLKPAHKCLEWLLHRYDVKKKIKKKSFHLYQLLFHKVQQRTYTQFLCSTVIDCSGSVVLGTVQSSWH